MMPAHHKAGLIEIVRIFVEDTVFGLGIMHKCKPLANSLLVFAFSPLVIVFMQKTYTKLWLAFDEVVISEFTSRGRVAFA